MGQTTRSKFYLGMSALLLFFVIVGFSRSLFLKTWFEIPDLPIHLNIHGAVLTCWFFLALAQPLLIRRHQVKLHRKVGVAGIFLAVAVVLTGVMTLVHRDFPNMDEMPHRAGPNLASLLMFLTCVIFGVLLRRRSEAHKRLMLLASIPIVSPALDRFGRIPNSAGFPESAFGVVSRPS